MADIGNPHDRFFRELFSRRDAAEEFIRSYLPPEIVVQLDLSKLEITKDSFIDAELRSHFSDLVYRTRLSEGGEALLYLLFEHKSHPDLRVGFQLLRYAVRLWEALLRQRGGGSFPPMVPVVLYHGQVDWEISTEFSDLLCFPDPLAPYVPKFLPKMETTSCRL